MVSLDTYAIWSSDRGPVTTTHTHFSFHVCRVQIKVVIGSTWIVPSIYTDKIKAHHDKCPVEILRHSTPYISKASLDWWKQRKLLSSLPDEAKKPKTLSTKAWLSSTEFYKQYCWNTFTS